MIITQLLRLTIVKTILAKMKEHVRISATGTYAIVLQVSLDLLVILVSEYCMSLIDTVNHLVFQLSGLSLNQ